MWLCGGTEFTKIRGHLKILGTIRVTSKFHFEDPQILGATVQNLGATAIWDPEFVHPCVCVCACVRARVRVVVVIVVV